MAAGKCRRPLRLPCLEERALQIGIVLAAIDLLDSSFQLVPGLRRLNAVFFKKILAVVRNIKSAKAGRATTLPSTVFFRIGRQIGRHVLAFERRGPASCGELCRADEGVKDRGTSRDESFADMIVLRY